jgi:acid phosphatase (class A)
MIRIFSCLFTLLITAALAVPATAQEAGKAFYVGPDEVDLVHVLGPPPPMDSPDGKADLQAVLTAVQSRTEASIRQAQEDDARTVFRFADVMGPNFKPENLPLAARFFERVHENGNALTLAVKSYFKRQRPFTVDPDIKIIVDQKPDFSYPSNHSTFAYETAILLAAMVPEKAAAIFDRAADYAHNRVVAGVHFPTDIVAGHIAASVIDNAYMHNPRFLADFARARSEVRSALGLKAHSSH